MQFTLLINQVKALEWGLNAQQSMLFAFIYELSSWADAIDVDGETYYRLSKGKIIRELPLLTDKPDTAYRLLKQLEAAGLIALGLANHEMAVAITDKGRMWNKSGEDLTDSPVGNFDFSVDKPRKKIRPSEKNPRNVGKKSELTSEKNPTYQITNNQITKSHHHGESSPVDNAMVGFAEQVDADREARCRASYELFCKAYPRDPYGNAAWEAFCELCPDDTLLDHILRAIAHQRTELAWHRDNGRWVPKPEKWLRQRRWMRSPGARVDQCGEAAPARVSEKNPVVIPLSVDPEIARRRGDEMRAALAGSAA